jgi:RecJ-like exonuclease
VQLVKADAERHRSLVTALAKDISGFVAPNMAALVEYVNDTSARLGVIMSDETAVLAHFPTWPQVCPNPQTLMPEKEPETKLTNSGVLTL